MAGHKFSPGMAVKVRGRVGTIVRHGGGSDWVVRIGGSLLGCNASDMAPMGPSAPHSIQGEPDSGDDGEQTGDGEETAE